ncbi:MULTISPECIES: beta-N-acetylhexosaminidase [unclassified Streptomyces]|uniref:beta-N-acetylhexosaminidase n=1 Tax=unclassified Streptomyces TaxID=2593676 RepID=UPI00255294B5|nr:MULTISPECIES: beta-N-acetylhexosaminidase [unclassified Streptomyces]WRZ64955.1 beta-N-acetylhexosaminidase [Streptomyces sp. NBC_01257]WSU58954.1 beta-N-acetylhexosaminidase [Streptomyces sp. NBC_01104]
MRLHTARRSALPRLLGSLLLVTAAGISTACAAPTASAAGSGPAASEPRPLGQIVPAPVSVRPGGSPYSLTGATRIRVESPSGEVRKIGEYLAGVLRPSTGYALPVTGKAGSDGIRLRLGSHDSALGAEGYTLTSERGSVTITARKPAGLFHGVQTLRQLLPARIESDSRQKGPWKVAGGRVTDAPRYAYRGAMLDVSRHFFSVTEVKRYIDQIAQYKMNTFHIHLSDDQGWRIAVDSWPKLATYGGSTEVDGGPGGYYTKSEYKEIVRYAASRYLEVVPEIDMPGHTNAALASYAELNCDGVAPPLYTGIKVGFSSLCAAKDVTYRFIDDVIGELAELTPGRYIHIGGDEAHSTSHEDYAKIMERAQAAVGAHGKTVMGWHQLTGASPVKGAVAQYWGYDKTSAADRQQVADAAKNGTKLVLSPADRVYLDMKYNEDTVLGLKWAGLVEVQRSYDWDPATYLADTPADAVLGVEAPIWAETLTDSDDIDAMAFPRLPGAAELGWSPAETHDWDTYKLRLAALGPRFTAQGIDYYRSPQVPWPAEPAAAG